MYRVEFRDLGEGNRRAHIGGVALRDYLDFAERHGLRPGNRWPGDESWHAVDIAAVAQAMNRPEPLVRFAINAIRSHRAEVEYDRGWAPDRFTTGREA